ncbi:putative sulfate exporter family transporter [Chryseobacterium suipulveris]|uniref:Sulfate exporter family transporter n=1 Tax=Chryseobacterium suipulveris TaxID=2929800 RepID=A0ABY4BV91_9FLAO|nr:putative sulfate exporter family transporter [Chryseobacterium suipulveris]UOE41776.1 putative sulfate exporter family transporter [Chryseobacterium suipulveris]
MEKKTVIRILFLVIAGFTLTNWVSPPLALVAGILFVNVFGIPFNELSSYTKKILQYSVIGLGFGINLNEAAKAGSEGFTFTVFTIVLVLSLGLIIGKWLKIDKKISQLISVGTAICGGSAIAAVSPVIQSKGSQNSIALGVVFVLNAVALVIFPMIGNFFHLTQNQFGMWAAIAIHDTSSVVGAASKYGAEALKTATVVKLSRALWIIPVTLIFSFLTKTNEKVKFPYFILWFVVAIVINSFVGDQFAFPKTVSEISRMTLKTALFFIGAGLPLKELKKIGINPFLLGILLWLIISAVSLFGIYQFVA